MRTCKYYLFDGIEDAIEVFGTMTAAHSHGHAAPGLSGWNAQAHSKYAALCVFRMCCLYVPNRHSHRNHQNQQTYHRNHQERTLVSIGLVKYLQKRINAANSAELRTPGLRRLWVRPCPQYHTTGPVAGHSNVHIGSSPLSV